VNTAHEDRKARKEREENRGFAASALRRAQGIPRVSRDAAFAFIVYLVFTLALTWPLARGLAHDVPSDFGDPLFTMWVMAWDATHLGPGWWSANIFHPHPLALAYSEHFLPQALQALPLYLATANPILGYNVVFLSTFVLSGLGMFLFTRDLTGRWEGAMVAGLAYAFAPYRIASLPHLHVLSSAWLPFVLLGFRRYLATGRMPPLIGAVVAWVAQNLSSGYYIFFFGPAVVVYIAWELTVRHLWSNSRTVATIAAACAAVAVMTVPFMLPYLALRNRDFSPRAAREVDRFAADVYSYLTAAPNLRVWGERLRAWPKPESALFPGLTIVALAVFACSRAWRDARFAGWFTTMAIAMTLVLSTLVFGWSIRLPLLKITSLGRAGLAAAALLTIALVGSRAIRAATRRWFQQPAAMLSLIAASAVVLSLGTRITAKGRVVLESAPYALLYRFVPGFDALRVPSRFAMLVAFCLAGLVAIGVAAIADDRRRRLVALVAGALIAIEFVPAPFPINGNSTVYARADLAPLPDTVESGAGAPPVYRFIASLPSNTVILELPLGEPAFDIRYMFYSTRHWKPLVNGYSGGEPPDYELLDTRLQDITTRPDRAWQALLDSRATHVIVHEALFVRDEGPSLTAWIAARGGREVARFGGDAVVELPR
jgi:hypothetical protein